MASLHASFAAVITLMAISVFAQESQTVDEPKKSDDRDDSPVTRFRGHVDEVTYLAFGEDSQQVVSASQNAVCIWEASTGKEIRRLKVEDHCTVGISRDLSRMAIGRPFYFGPLAGPMNGMLTLQLTASGKESWSVNPHGNFNRDVPFPPVIAALAFSPDGTLLVTAGGAVKVRGEWPRGIVKTWDTETGKELKTLGELSSRADSLAFSSDGKYLAAGTVGTSGESPESAEVHVWETATGQQLCVMKTRQSVEQGGNPGSIMQLSFHPNGRLLAAAVSDGTVRLWEMPSGRELLEIRGHQGLTGNRETDRFTGLILDRLSAVRAVTFSPDGRRLASAGYDQYVRIWNSETGEQTSTVRYDSPRINAVAISPDGQSIAAAGVNATNSSEVAIWKWNDKPSSLGEPVTPTIRKDERARHEKEVRSQIETALKSDDPNWQNLNSAQRSIRDRIVKVFYKSVELNDQQVVTAVYLLTIGRSPTDSESKQVQMDFAETKNRPLSALQHAREMVQTREFNTGLANTSDRLYQIQSAIAAKRAAGEIPVLMAANDFQQFAADCATSVHQITKTDEQFVDLTFLLVLSRFPSESEASKLVPHLKNTPNRDTATKDIFVFLLNSQEFVDQR